MVIPVILIVVCIIGACWSSSKDDFSYVSVWTASMFIVGFVAIRFVLNMDVLEVLQSVVPHLLLVFGIYLAVGLIWSLIKWFFFIREHYKLIKLIKESYISGESLTDAIRDIIGAHFGRKYASKIEHHTFTTVSNAEQAEFKKLSLEERFARVKTKMIEAIIPKAKDQMKRIIGWVSYWPFSMISFILKDLMEKIYRNLVNLFRGVYDFISNKYKAVLERNL